MMRRLGLWVFVVGMGTAFGAFGTIAHAARVGVVKPEAQHFTTVGKVTSFQFLPESYRDAEHPNEFFYDVFYYIPETLKDSKKVKALIFNHGGGNSTLTRAGSIQTVGYYLPDLRRMADELQFVVVLPSANGLNWGGHTVGLMRELVRMLQADLRVDANRIGLSGHSMGGMGITRNYHLLADQFAFFLPLAAGMDLDYAPAEQTEWQINKVFNVPYIHLQGVNNHFDVFVRRCEEQLRRTQELENRYGAKSKLQMIFTNGDHYYDYETFKKHVQEAFLTGRHLSQKRLWGTITTGESWVVENRIQFKWMSSPRYFWIEAVEKDVNDGFHFYAQSKDNTITIDLKSKPQKVKTLRIHLSSPLVNLKKRVKIVIDGVHVATRRPKFFGLAKQHPESIDVVIPASR